MKKLLLPEALSQKMQTKGRHDERAQTLLKKVEPRASFTKMYSAVAGPRCRPQGPCQAAR